MSETYPLRPRNEAGEYEHLRAERAHHEVIIKALMGIGRHIRPGGTYYGWTASNYVTHIRSGCPAQYGEKCPHSPS